VSGSPGRYAVVGNPIAHSLSPRIHAAFAEQTGESLQYERLLVAADKFSHALDEFFHNGGDGLNITLPFKFAAAKWVDELDPQAAMARAVNTIVRLPSDPDAAPRYRGFNTDGAGLVNDLQRNLSLQLGGKRLLVLGAGGAVSGVVRPLAEQVPGLLVIANRSAGKAAALANRLAVDFPNLDIQGVSLTDVTGEFDLVINGTSAGLDNAVPDIAGELVAGALCYDMVYGGQTAFCRWALAQGAGNAVDGLGMLVEQAALAFALWRDKVPDTEPVLARLRLDG
jgi:shikimate dehydrogenase